MPDNNFCQTVNILLLPKKICEREDDISGTSRKITQLVNIYRRAKTVITQKIWWLANINYLSIKWQLFQTLVISKRLHPVIQNYYPSQKSKMESFKLLSVKYNTKI